MSPLAKRLRAIVHNEIIAPGSSQHEYAVAESHVREAAARIEELEAEVTGWKEHAVDLQSRILDLEARKDFYEYGPQKLQQATRCEPSRTNRTLHPRSADKSAKKLRYP